ncbi:MAG: hypothetical protein PWP64_950 [Candidatus Cloacimonadota bacterium]|jgi:hypothetical protein|nr:hypothetical protein [Candidatus Cloacimonadota bacterium]
MVVLFEQSLNFAEQGGIFRLDKKSIFIDMTLSRVLNAKPFGRL